MNILKNIKFYYFICIAQKESGIISYSPYKRGLKISILSLDYPCRHCKMENSNRKISYSYYPIGAGFSIILVNREDYRIYKKA